MAKTPNAGTIITRDGKRYAVKMLTPSKAKTVLRPYSTELGYLAIAWNGLHYHLMSLFALLSEPKNSASAKAVWYSIDSDFSQRKMLRAIIQTDADILPAD